MTHYINGNLPALAVRAVVKHGGAHLPADVYDGLLARLRSAALHESAGELLQHLQRPKEALDAFTECGSHSADGRLSTTEMHILCCAPHLQFCGWLWKRWAL